MHTLTIFCLGCKEQFNFTHPSVNRSNDLGDTPIRCKNCGAHVAKAEYHMVVEPVRSITERTLKGVDKLAAVIPIDLPQPYHGRDDGIRSNRPVIEPKTSRPVAHLPSSPLFGNKQLEAYKAALEANLEDDNA